MGQFRQEFTSTRYAYADQTSAKQNHKMDLTSPVITPAQRTITASIATQIRSQRPATYITRDHEDAREKINQTSWASRLSTFSCVCTFNGSNANTNNTIVGLKITAEIWRLRRTFE